MLQIKPKLLNQLPDLNSEFAHYFSLESNDSTSDNTGNSRKVVQIEDGYGTSEVDGD